MQHKTLPLAPYPLAVGLARWREVCWEERINPMHPEISSKVGFACFVLGEERIGGWLRARPLPAGTARFS